MGGRKKSPAGIAGTCRARLSRGGRLSERGRGAAGEAGERAKESGGLMGEVITRMAQCVIGRRVVLHDLLDSADFASIYADREGSRPLWKYRHVSGGPFCVIFLAHDLQYTKPHLTIVSNGYLKLVHGREIPVLMELRLEKIGVSPIGAAMQRAEGREPPVLDFNVGPVSFCETAFSFDIGDGPYGLTGSGFIAFPDWNG
jgi:hypothetical protein